MERMRALAVALIAVGCTSVRMVQREGCWVRQTERWPGRTTEELGFCAKPPPVWAEDRLARLVQECVAQADYRWQNRAIAAWGRGEPIPPQESDEKIAKTCMSEAAASLGLEGENAALKSRLSELTRDRETLREVTEKDREFLKQSNGDMVSALGEAAKKPAPAAVATATSTGTAKTESDLRSEQQPAATPPTTAIGLGATPAPVATAPAAQPKPVCAPSRPGRLGKPAGEDARCTKAPNPAPATAAASPRSG